MTSTNRTAAKTMESEKIGALVVIDDNQMVGIVTARDVQQAVAEFEPSRLDGVYVKLFIIFI